MTISEVSDQDLSRWIAEKIEPKPHEWRLGMKDIAWQYVGNISPEWKPNDFVNDTRMTVMLFKKLIDDYDLITAAELLCETPAALNDGTSESFNRATAEAWALANGWPQ